MKPYIISLLLSLLTTITIYGQDVNLSSDELFSRARNVAFELKDYPQAIRLIKSALDKSPEYTDLHIFLGRLYTWSDKIDSAARVFENLHAKKIRDEDFYLAYGYLLYWNNQNEKAKIIIDEGLSQHPQSEDILLLHAKFNYGIKAYQHAESSVNTLLNINPKNTEANSLAQNLKSYTAKNAISINYDFTHFDKQFDDNWHILGVSYRRATSLGSVIFKTNYANKFADNGLQFELEAYPRINKIFYLYLGTGYSDNVGIFPRYRTGVSLYANLPKSFEGEIGYRQLNFSNNIWLYTASIGKYYQNLWFNLRTYLSPDKTNISHSYTGTVRYYLKGADDYFGLQVGTGISPEENRNNLLVEDSFKLKTYKVGANYNFSIKKRNLVSIAATYFNQEFQVSQKGNQYDLSIGYSRVF
jgi:YaiO family outer membrane protein